MNPDDIIDVPAVERTSRPAPGAVDTASDADASLKAWGWASYILHLIVAVAVLAPGAQASLLLLLIALIMDLVKKDDAAGTWQASHFGWRIRSVLGAGVLYLVTAPLWLLFIVPGWIAWTLISVWFLYRIILGMARMNAGRPVGAA